MQHAISTLMGLLRKSFFVILCVGLLSGSGWMFAQPGYAASSPNEYLQEIQRDQSQQNRQEVYRQATEVTEDPKMGVEKEYEQEVQEYYQENPEEGGVLQGAKNLVDKVTGKDE